LLVVEFTRRAYETPHAVALIEPARNEARADVSGGAGHGNPRGFAHSLATFSASRHTRSRFPLQSFAIAVSS
jgi:hypothetical protein